MTKNKLRYYNVFDDIAKYPDAWCYVVYSRRGPGKTYGYLDGVRTRHVEHLYMKRTNDDVDLLTSGNKYGFDPSPYAPINRDKGCNVHAVKIREGLGAFHNMDDDYNPIGAPLGYALSLNATSKFKGFDFSNCDFMCLDEFLPLPGTIVKQSEGETLLDMYMTVSRDRQKRGKEALKLILFANAEDVSSPVTDTLEIVDPIMEMNARHQNYLYDEMRGIMIHHVNEIPLTSEEQTGIFKAMEGTAWHAKSFGGEFAKNDYTLVTQRSIKCFKPFIHLKHKTHDFYIYVNHGTGMYYMTTKKAKALLDYDLNRETEQKQFYIERMVLLRSALLADRFEFEKYSMYDLMMNYRKKFRIGC